MRVGLRVADGPERRVLPPDADEVARGRVQVHPPRVLVPAHPRGRVVEAVAVVVATLRAAAIVAHRDHGDARGDEQGAEQVARGAASGREDGGVARRALHSVVPGAVRVRAVAVGLAVAAVVLAVVRGEVREREAVVRGDEGDGGERAAIGGERAGGSREAGGERPHAVRGAAGAAGLGDVGEPEVAHDVAVAVVPLAPAGSEPARAPAAHAHVPRLGDHEEPLERLVLDDGAQQRVRGVEVDALVAPEGHGEVEAEAVDAHDVGPVLERVEHEALRVGPGQVDRVAAARHVDGRPIRRVPVVPRAVDAAEARDRAVGSLLGGVVVDHVEHDLDPGGVQRVDHATELGGDRVGPGVARGAGGVGRVRGEVGERVVAPVVDASLRAQPLLARGRVHGQELDRRDPQVDKALHRGRVPQPRVRAAQLLGQPLVELGEAAHVQLVEHLAVARHDRSRGTAGGALLGGHLARGPPSATRRDRPARGRARRDPAGAASGRRSRRARGRRRRAPSMRCRGRAGRWIPSRRPRRPAPSPRPPPRGAGRRRPRR